MTLTFDEAQRLGWATEVTLRELVANSRGTPQLLKLIGERFKIDDAALQRAYLGAETSARRTAQAGQAAANNLGRGAQAASEATQQTSKTMEELRRAMRIESNEYIDIVKSLKTADITNFMDDGARKLKGLGGQFADAGGQIGAFGKLAGKAGTVLQLFNETLKRLEEVMQDFTKVYAAGAFVETGLTGLAQAASGSGLMISQFAEIMSRNAAVAVTLGTRNMAALGNRFQRLTNQSGALMMSQQEGATAFFEVMEMMRTSGEMTGLSQEQLAQRGVGLLKNFNELAIATGRNRDELRKQTADIMRQPLTSLMSRLLPQEGRQRLTDFTANMAAQFGSQANVLTSMVERVASAGGSFGLIDDSMKPLLAIVPGFGQALQRAANNNLSGAERAAELARVFDNLGERGEAQLRTLAMANPALAGQVEQLLQMRAQAKAAREQLQREAEARGLTIEQLEEERRQTQQRLGQIRGSMNGVNAAMARLNNAFTKIAGALSGVITPVLDILAGGLNVVSYLFEKMADIIEPVVYYFNEFRQAIMRGIDNIMSLFGQGRDEGTDVEGSSLAGVVGSVIAIALPLIGMKLLMGTAAGLAAKAVTGGAMAAAGGVLSAAVPGAVGMLGRRGAAGAAATATTAAAAAPAAAGAGGAAAARGASAVGTFLGGLGSGIGKILEGLATGISAFAKPQVVLGAAAIGASIAAIGAGIAAASWLMGRALPSLAEGMTQLAAVDGDALGRTGSGMISIGAGLAAMAAGNIVSGISSLITLIPNLFGGGPMGQLRQFSEMAPRLELAATSISSLTNSLTQLTALDLTPLQGLSAISNFANSMNERAVANLARTVNNPQFAESLRNIVLAVQPPAAAQPQAPAAGPAAPVITTGELNQRTIDYYDESLRNFTEMVELLRIANLLSRENNDITERGNTNLESAMRSINRV